MIHYLLLSLIRTSGAVFVYVISLFRGPKYIFIIIYFHLQIKVTTTSANIGFLLCNFLSVNVCSRDCKAQSIARFYQNDITIGTRCVYVAFPSVKRRRSANAAQLAQVLTLSEQNLVFQPAWLFSGLGGDCRTVPKRKKRSSRIGKTPLDPRQ